LSTHISAISNASGTLLYNKGTSEDFVKRTNASQIMCTMGVLAGMKVSV
jgi:hypothetical protein